MSKREKLLTKARNNPNGLHLEEFESLLRLCGWIFDHQKGSHRIWYSPFGKRLPIQPKGGMAKGYQVKQFLACYDQEESNGV
jgi:predicted RNA binding protein YcfA (HicA-like mRNA interferase family)